MKVIEDLYEKCSASINFGKWSRKTPMRMRASEADWRIPSSPIVVRIYVVVVKSGAERKEEGGGRGGRRSWRREQLRQTSNNPNLKGGEKPWRVSSNLLEKSTFLTEFCVKMQKKNSKTIVIYMKQCKKGILMWKLKKDPGEAWWTLFRDAPPGPTSRRK